MLTTTETNRILIELVLGQEPTIHGEEADALREKLIPEIAAIGAKGGIVMTQATDMTTQNDMCHHNGEPLPLPLADFREWLTSDLMSNIIRGALAEWIVGRALGVTGPRVDWHPYDLLLPNGLRVEVKSSSHWQSWPQPKGKTRVSFDIGPKQLLDPVLNQYAGTPIRPADLYVFALHSAPDRASANPTDIAQWQFYVVPTTLLNAKCPAQKKIGLAALRQLAGTPVGFADLQSAVASASQATAA